MPLKYFNIISLFSGAGGLDIAACSTSRVNKIVSTDLNATFLETTKLNLPIHFPSVEHECIVEDSAVLKGSDLQSLFDGDVDIVMGGPPCDDYTRFGKCRGVEGEKGPAIFDFLRLVDELRPQCFLFENVPNLAHQFKNVFNQFLQYSSDIGYGTMWDILSVADYGSPTIRKRIFVVGWPKKFRNNSLYKFPQPSHGDITQGRLFDVGINPYVSVEDVLHDVPDVDTPESANFENHTKRLHRESTIDHIKTIPQGCKVNKSFRYRAPWAKPCRTLTAGLDNSTKSHLHPIYHREMTVREYARIHGFPDTWIFQGTRSNGLKQVANAIPIPIGISIFESIIKVIQ